MKITPTDEQAEAIEAIAAWYSETPRQTFLLDGGAGTGKTTTAALAIDHLKIEPADVVYGAYTAKAARVMRWKGMQSATTLHQLLYAPYTDKNGNTQWRKVGKQSPCASAYIIVVDEVSMLDEAMANDILEFKKPVLVLGDVQGQLPPIAGRGAFTNRPPDFRLNDIQRTVAESPINRLAWQARGGRNLLPPGFPGARVMPFHAAGASWPLVFDRSWQVICGKHSVRRSITRECRKHFDFSGRTPSPMEPLICRKNNYTDGFINGDTCTIWRIIEQDEQTIIADVLIDGELNAREEVEISRKLFDAHFTDGKINEDDYDKHDVELDWAYAITCHSAQGSEFDKVIVVDDKFMKWDRDMRRRWMYTAITRAREEVVVLQLG